MTTGFGSGKYGALSFTSPTITMTVLCALDPPPDAETVISCYEIMGIFSLEIKLKEKSVTKFAEFYMLTNITKQIFNMFQKE